MNMPLCKYIPPDLPGNFLRCNHIFRSYLVCCGTGVIQYLIYLCHMVIQLTTAMLTTKVPASVIIVRQGLLVSKTTAMRPNSQQNDMRKTSKEVPLQQVVYLDLFIYSRNKDNNLTLSPIYNSQQKQKTIIVYCCKY